MDVGWLYFALALLFCGGAWLIAYVTGPIGKWPRLLRKRDRWQRDRAARRRVELRPVAHRVRIELALTTTDPRTRNDLMEALRDVELADRLYVGIPQADHVLVWVTVIALSPREAIASARRRLERSGLLAGPVTARRERRASVRS